MAMRKSCLIVFLVIFSLAIHDANAGWKFWKKDKDSEATTTTTTTTSTTTTTIAPPTSKTSTVKPSTRGAVNKGIANAADPGLIIGVGANGNTIKNNARPQQPNPGTEVGQEFPGSRPNRPATGGINNKGYRDWAVDLTGAGEPVNNNAKAPGSPVTSPQQPPAAGVRPPSPSNSNPAQSRPTPTTPGSVSASGNGPTGGQKPPVTVSIPGNGPNNGQKPPTTNPTGGNVPINGQKVLPPSPTSVNSPSGPKVPVVIPSGNGQKPQAVAPPSPTGSKSWAEVAGGGSKPASPTPTPSPSGNQQNNRQIQPTQPQPTRPTSSGVLPAIAAGGSAAAAAAAAANKPVYTTNPVYSKGTTVTDDDLVKLAEAMFIKDKNNAWRHITLNLQKKTSSGSPTDEAPQPLLTVNNDALKESTIEKVRQIYDNYHLDTRVTEQISPLQRDEEAQLIDKFLSTDVMSMAMRFLSDKGLMKRDYYEYKFLLRQIWFSLYSRGEGRIGSSGFEHVFMTELKLGNEVTGLHNWIYFNDEEVKKRADYLGYIKKLDLGDKAAILKLHAKFDGLDKPVTSMFIGTSPELEMALYTVCFYARSDKSCPVQLGGSKFNIITHKFRYRGKDVIGSAYPEI